VGGVSGETDGEGVRGARGDWEWEGGRAILTGSSLFVSLLFEATDAIESGDGACWVLQVILGIREDGTE
jgi:hypothetical protein